MSKTYVTFLTRQKMWRIIRTTDDFSVRQLARSVGAKESTARGYIQGLLSKGYIRKRNRKFSDEGKQTYYKLTNDIGQHAPQLKGDGGQDIRYQRFNNLWRTMRVLKQFVPSDLARIASVTDCMISQKQAAEYCSSLASAGLLGVSLKQGDEDTYVLLSTNAKGPMPPLVTTVIKVFDPNTKEVKHVEQV